jgi:hypothetical protein
MTDDLETRLRAAVHAEADAVDRAHAQTAGLAEDASLPAIRSRVRTIRRRRRTLAAVAAVAVVVVGVAALPRLGDDSTDVDTYGPAGPDQTTTPPADRPGATTTAAPSTDAAQPGGTTAGATTTAPGNEGEGAADAIDPTGPDVVGDGYQPLWPFPTRASAAEWQQAYREGGQQPWHLSAEDTALSFTTGFLGFTEIDQITSTDIGATEAEIGVGYANGGQTSTSAVIHLLRWDSSEDSPWEVVGTRDTSLVLETPDYGTTASSPMTVAGYIDRNDERVQARLYQASSSGPLGESQETVSGGGGTRPVWGLELGFNGATDPAVTVVAFSGGDVQEVELFAITGLRTPTG